ncbi:MAG TPA: low temperature requirement protein A [Gaiellaceae bacterium]
MTEHRVSPIELFFDLVFVFALTQVTTLWFEQPTWAGLGRGLLVLAALWWVWASYAWLTNAADVEAGFVTGVLLCATAALFVAALAVPEAFGAQRFVFGGAFFVVMVAFVGLYAIVSKHEPDLLAAVLRTSWTVVPGAALVLVAAFVPSGARPALWGVAFLAGFFGPIIAGVEGWRIQPAHFAERHSLIVIIAIGESLGAIGFGARGTHLGGDVIAAALLGFLVSSSFWLSYFDYASIAVQDRLAANSGAQQVALARDAYTYGHLPMVAGISLFAFGMRETLKHVGAHLHWVPAVALCCGCALYMFSFVAVRLRITHGIGRGRPVAMVAFALLTLAATHVAAITALALVCVVCIGLHAYELTRWRENRSRIRAGSLAEV